MIIQCEECGKKFDLDEFLLKKGGSSVRCSVCGHVFKAHPPEDIFLEEVNLEENGVEELEDTMIQDSPPFLDEVVAEAELRGKDIDFNDVFEEALDVGQAERAPAFSPARPRRSPVLLLVLVIVLAVLGGGAAVVSLAPEHLPKVFSFLKPAQERESADPGTRRLSFEEVDGKFLISEKEGKLYVVRGIVVNNYPKKRSYIRLKGTILDDDGKRVLVKSVYAGNTYEDADLKILSMKEINKAMNKRLGMGRKNLNVASGEGLPFMIVFEKLPKNLSEFEIEAMSSAPGA